MILENVWVLILVAVWTIPWKGWALWKSARKNQHGWFIVLLIFNSLAILDILYIFIFSEKNNDPQTNSSDGSHSCCGGHCS